MYSVAVLRDINAVCDYLLEAEQWAEELARLPREERGELYGLPVLLKGGSFVCPMSPSVPFPMSSFFCEYHVFCFLSHVS